MRTDDRCWRFCQAPGLCSCLVVAWICGWFPVSRPWCAFVTGQLDPRSTLSDRCPGRRWKIGRARTGLPFVSSLWCAIPGSVEADVARSASAESGTGACPPARYRRGVGGGAWWRSPRPRSCSLAIAYLGLGSEELSGLGAFVEHLRLAETPASRDSRPARVRLFDFAYFAQRLQPETSARASRATLVAPDVDALLADAAAGKRLAPRTSCASTNDAPLLDLGAAADARRRALHPEGRRHVHHRPQRQLHQRVRHARASSAISTGRPERGRLHAVARGAGAEVRRRRSTWAACRSCCRGA